MSGLNVVSIQTSVERIKPKDRDAVVQALRAGVVPRLGLRHVQVGRAREVEEIVRDIDRIGEGGSAVRFIIGEYGSGKTFFLNLARSAAMERKLVVSHADLSPDRRIHASGGQARSLYAELIRNMSTRSKPEGGALSAVLERFISLATEGQSDGAAALREKLAPIQEMVSGYDFTSVIEFYWRALEEGNETGKAAALRWLRGEYNLKTEAREALGVRTIIDDSAVYDYLKVMGRFTRLAGFGGFMVVLDEMVNLFKLTNAQARNANYEQILRIINDVLQGSAEGLGFYFGGTPEFLMDSRRGLYSYEALRSRLAENSFARDGLVDLTGPVIRLQSLKPENLYVLLEKLRHLFAGGDPSAYMVPNAALGAFLEHCSKRVGNSYFSTPRNTIKAFLDLLSVLQQNPDADWHSLLGKIEIPPDAPPAGGDIDEDASGQSTLPRPSTPKVDGLANFRI